MNIVELKECINKKSIPDELLIFKYSDNTFTVNQYIKSISEIKNKKITYIDNLKDIVQENSLLENDSIYVYNTDNLEQILDKNNLIIICKSIDKDITDNCKNIIEMPKLENWQIKDYIKLLIPKIEEDKIDWLCKITNYDIYRLDNEIKKLKLISKVPQNETIKNLALSGNYKDLSLFNIFDLSNSIIKKDISKLSYILEEIPHLDIEPMALTILLEKNFINILNIQTNPRITPEDLGLNLKQFNAVKYNCGKYSNPKIIEILKLLTSIDYLIKSGSISYENVIYYLIINILN